MAKKQTRRSISVSRTTYERLKAFCETNNISMSQLVETRVNDFLGDAPVPAASTTPAVPRPIAPRPMPPAMPSKPVESRPPHVAGAPAASPSSAGAVSPASSSGSAAPSSPGAAHAPHPPMTSAAARFAVDPPPPIIKPRQETAAPKPAEKRPEQIFTF
ncbi:MAG: hypothetical protein E6J91_31305 [Deltaproteobacteria bacterium]|nr:MAG: hypothetical protein E6J91_31305 [Deltaproteobacteria bacterium]